MKKLILAAFLLSSPALAGTVECQVRDANGKQGKATFTLSRQSENGHFMRMVSQFEFDGQELPALRESCAFRNGANLCVHTDGAGNRFDMHVHGGMDFDSVVLGVIHWAENKPTKLEVRQNCDPASKWE